ncbi:MAG: TlpA family protein disulfide reductase [Pyrinomonadaceae bacterium]
MLILCTSGALARGGGREFTGHFDALIPYKEDDEQVVFKAITHDQVKGDIQISEKAHLSATHLLDPRTQKYSVLALLVEERGENPAVYADLNGDKSFSADEKFVLKPGGDDNPYLWEATVELKSDDELFKTVPVFLRFFKSFKIDKMGPDDRLFEQTTSVLARGAVDVDGKKVVVVYEYDAGHKKVDPRAGQQGMDLNGDGEVDMAKMSSESTKAKDETMVYRVGSGYYSTKKADISGNVIVLVERDAKDYKRIEVEMNKEFPDFAFTDFDGKKHRFSEFKGKYVLIDIWGFWCGPCRHELPYQREAIRRFASRNFTIVGLNTDEDLDLSSMKKALGDNGMTWTQAQFTSVSEFLRSGLRVSSFPTTFLVSPDGKILSIGRTDKDEPDLRGKDLLESLDKILPVM